MQKPMNQDLPLQALHDYSKRKSAHTSGGTKPRQSTKMSNSNVATDQASYKESDHTRYLEPVVSKTSPKNEEAAGLRDQDSITEVNEGTQRSRATPRIKFGYKVSETQAQSQTQSQGGTLGPVGFGGLTTPPPEALAVLVPSIQITNGGNATRQRSILNEFALGPDKKKLRDKSTGINKQWENERLLPDVHRKGLIASIYDSHKTLSRANMPLPSQYSGHLAGLNFRTEFLEGSNSVAAAHFRRSSIDKHTEMSLPNEEIDDQRHQIGVRSGLNFEKKKKKLLGSEKDEAIRGSLGYHQTNPSLGEANVHSNASQQVYHSNSDAIKITRARGKQQSQVHISSIFTDGPSPAQQSHITAIGTEAGKGSGKDRYSTIYGLQNEQSDVMLDRKHSLATIDHGGHSTQSLLLFLNQKDQMLRNLREKQNKYHLQKNVSTIRKSVDQLSLAQSQQIDVGRSFDHYLPKLTSLDRMDRKRKSIQNYDFRDSLQQTKSLIMERSPVIREGNLGMDPYHTVKVSDKVDSLGQLQTLNEKKPRKARKGRAVIEVEHLKTEKLNEQSVQLEVPLSLANFEASGTVLLNDKSGGSIDHIADPSNRSRSNLALSAKLSAEPGHYLKKKFENSKAEKIQAKINEIERRRIEAAINNLDQVEIEIKDKIELNQHKVAKDYDSSLGLYYFEQVRNNLYQVFMEPEPAGKRSVQLYSRQLSQFVDTIVKGISLQLKQSEKYIKQGVLKKEGKIQDQKTQINQLREEIKKLKTELLAGRGVRASDLRQEEIEKYMDGKAILEAGVGHKGAGTVNDKPYFDVNELLKESHYSGARQEMEEILKNHTFLESVHVDADKDFLRRPAPIAPELLDDRLRDEIGTDMNAYLRQKAQEVQVGTSKKVIRQFHRNIKMVDSCAQTAGEATEVIDRLTERITALQEEYSECRTELFQAKLDMDTYNEKLGAAKVKGMAAARQALTDKQKLGEQTTELEELYASLRAAKEDVTREKASKKAFQETQLKKQFEAAEQLLAQDLELKTLRALRKDQAAMVAGAQRQIDQAVQARDKKAEQLDSNKKLSHDQHKELVRLNQSHDELTEELMKANATISELTVYVKKNSTATRLDKDSVGNSLHDFASKDFSRTQGPEQATEPDGTSLARDGQRSISVNEGDEKASQGGATNALQTRTKQGSEGFKAEAPKSNNNEQAQHGDNNEVHQDFEKNGPRIPEKDHKNSTGPIGGAKLSQEKSKTRSILGKMSKQPSIAQEDPTEQAKAGTREDESSSELKDEILALAAAGETQHDNGSQYPHVESLTKKVTVTQHKGAPLCSQCRVRISNSGNLTDPGPGNLNGLGASNSQGEDAHRDPSSQVPPEPIGNRMQPRIHVQPEMTKFEKILNPNRYQYYLEKPKEDLQKSESSIQRILGNRVSRPRLELPDPRGQVGGWSPEAGSMVNKRRSLAEDQALMFDQQTQTLIDTETFVNILAINRNNEVLMTQSIATLDSCVKANQLMYQQGYRPQAGQVSFGQSVNPAQIAHGFEVLRLELKNQRIFGGSDATSGLRGHSEASMPAVRRHLNATLNHRSDSFERITKSKYSSVPLVDNTTTKYRVDSKQGARKSAKRMPQNLSQEEARQLELQAQSLVHDELLGLYGNDYQALLNLMEAKETNRDDGGSTVQGASFDNIDQRRFDQQNHHNQGQQSKVSDLGIDPWDQIVAKSPPAFNPIAYIKQRNEETRQPHAAQILQKGKPVSLENFAFMEAQMIRQAVAEEQELQRLQQQSQQQQQDKLQGTESDDPGITKETNIDVIISSVPQKKDASTNIARSPHIQDQSQLENLNLQYYSIEAQVPARLKPSPIRVSHGAGGAPSVGISNQTRGWNVKAQISPRYERSGRMTDQLALVNQREDVGLNDIALTNAGTLNIDEMAHQFQNAKEYLKEQSRQGSLQKLNQP